MQQQQINSQTPQQSTNTQKVRRKRDFSQVIDPTANQGTPGQAGYAVPNVPGQVVQVNHENGNVDNKSGHGSPQKPNKMS